MLTLPPPTAIVRVVDLSGSNIGDQWLSLTRDEQQVVRLVAQGLLNKQIAYTTGVALRTVEDRRRRAMVKIGVDSVIGLARFIVRAEDLKLIELEGGQQ